MSSDLDTLRAETRGTVIGPPDPDYDAARAVRNGMIDRADLGLFEFADDAETAWHEISRRDLDFPRPFSSPEQIGPAATL